MEESTKLKTLWTRVDQETLLVIAEFLSKYKFAPTMKEIAIQRGRSANSAKHTMRRLREQGLLAWEGGSHRKMGITPQGAKALVALRRQRKSAGSSELTPQP